MSNDLVVFDDEKVALVKEMFCKNATKSEFELFLHMAKRLNLDPALKQIYFIKFGNQMSIITGIDGYRIIADRTGKYMPGRESSFTYDKEGKLFSATAYLKKLGPDNQWHEISSTAIRSEYDSGKNQWAKGPHYMLAKCAESLALRRAFPAEMAGTNTEEEMEKAIIDVESTKSSGGGQIAHKPPVDPITVAEALKLHEMIGDDKEYLNTILKTYKAADFTDIDRQHLGFIMERVEIYNKKRLEKEMGNG